MNIQKKVNKQELLREKNSFWIFILPRDLVKHGLNNSSDNTCIIYFKEQHCLLNNEEQFGNDFIS